MAPDKIPQQNPLVDVDRLRVVIHVDESSSPFRSELGQLNHEVLSLSDPVGFDRHRVRSLDPWVRARVRVRVELVDLGGRICQQSWMRSGG